MRQTVAIVVFLVIASVAATLLRSQEPRPAAPSLTPATAPAPDFVGSSSCRSCHENFYKLWSTSFHGLAMQPYTPQFARANLTAHDQDIAIGMRKYRADVAAGSVRETTAAGSANYPIVHVMGGKNVYYFLTPLERGRLQVLPLAYDVHKKIWFDTAGSAVRHFMDHPDSALDWRDPPYTFNTSCYGCHVSQLANTYDPKTDSYHTTWGEAGINCETCHGSAAEHVRTFQAAPRNNPPKDIKLIVTSTFNHEQHNSACAPCHAKMMPLTVSFKPGERYFDHYDLVTLENQDFYPDGRDLGENYTFTGWRMSPCAKSGKLDCTYCHTSSGRYRFADAAVANNACMPCHETQVKSGQAHTHHKPGSEGAKCISCHMPMTGFARMHRSDHTMLPPTPAATIAFKSPNACNNCHTDHDAAWADQLVRQWHPRDYQAPILARAKLLDAAKKQDWSRLPDMLAYIASPDRDEIFATSFIRQLADCPDPAKWPAMLAAMKDPSPLVRSSAAAVLGNGITPEVRDALLAATTDEYRLVRVRAARSLAAFPRDQLSEKDRARLDGASQELETSLECRPDDWASQFNLGSYWADREQLTRAIDCYQAAARLRTDTILPLVNASLVYARLGQTAQAEQNLRKALKIEPNNGAANFNLGLLRAEQGDLPEAKTLLAAAFKADPTLAAAAYNLGVLLANDRPDEAIEWCRKAANLRPDEPRYGYTLAFYLAQQRRDAEARQTLQAILQREPAYMDAVWLLGSLFEKQQRPADARAVYERALSVRDLPAEDRARLEQKLSSLR